MTAKATEAFNEYMEFLEIKSEELEDFSVHDEGGQALHYLLVKLMSSFDILPRSLTSCCTSTSLVRAYIATI